MKYFITNLRAQTNKNKSAVAYSFQGIHTGHLDFCKLTGRWQYEGII